MRNKMLVSMTAVMLMLPFSSVLLGQSAGEPDRRIDHTAAQPSAKPPEGWERCPRCQNNTDRAEAWAISGADNHPFDSHDLTGIWGFEGSAAMFRGMPPLTPWGQEKVKSTPGESPTARSNLQTRACNPLGYPRQFGQNYGMEFVMLPDRVLQFFEWGHTFRTIWTDGRKLPADPPEPRWLGWNVGHWEGDTFVVESNGYDERIWMSDEMRIVERYRRVNWGTLDAEVTVTDPKAFTRPWVVHDTIKLVPRTEMWEFFCVPSDEQDFENRVSKPVRTGGKE